MLLEYDFTVVGSANVEKALASLERRFAQHNARINSMFGTRGGAGGGRTGIRAAGGGAGSAASAVEREQSAALRRAEREQIASAKRVERERISAERAVGREQQKQQDYWAKARQKSRERDRSESMAAAGARADFVRGTVGRGVGRVFGAARALGSAGLAVTGVGGAALAASAVSEATRLDDMARRTSIQGRAAGEQGMDPDQLRRRYTRTGIATGLAPEQVAAGVSRYVDRTGDLQGGLTHMGTFATIAQASGAKTEDLADSAWALRQAGVTSKDDVASSLSTLYAQGKKGSFKLSDQAQYLPALIARGRDFGLKGKEGIKGLGGLLQITQDATGDAAETATGVADMFSELTSHASKMASGKSFSGRKVDVYEKGDAKNGARNIRDIIADTLTASKGDSSQIEEVFGKRAIKPLLGMTTAFKDTRLEALKGGDKEDVATQKGRAAALKIWDNASDVKGDFASAQKDASDAMKGFGVQLQIIEAELKDAVASELFPVLRELTPELVKLIGPVRDITVLMIKLAEMLVDHPLMSLGAVLAASVAAEVIKAQLGSVLEEGVARLTGGGSGKAIFGGVGTSGANGATGAGILGAVGTGAAIGVTLATAIFTAGVVNFENAEVNMKTAGNDLSRVRDAGLGDIDMVRAKVKENRDKVFDLENPGIAAGAANLISYGSTKDETQLATQKAFGAEMERKLSALDSFKGLADSLAKAGVSQEKAAAELSEAAKKLGLKMPNTGNSPSPVKP